MTRKEKKMKTIFLDADGTLFHHKGYVPESAFEAIERAQKNGHKIVLCTGRQKTEIYGGMETIPYDAMIVGSGCCVIVKDKIVYDEGFDKDQLAFLIHYLHEHEIPATFESTHHIYGTKQTAEELENLKKIWCGHLDKEEYEKHGVVLMANQVQVVEEEDLLQYPINKISFMETDLPYSFINKDLSDQFHLVRSTFAPFGQDGGEIMDVKHSKASGIDIVQKVMNLDPKDFISIGDGDNDLAMFDKCAFNVAMENGTEEIKEKADYITTDLENDGIYNAFKYLELI